MIRPCSSPVVDRLNSSILFRCEEVTQELASTHCKQGKESTDISNLSEESLNNLNEHLTPPESQMSAESSEAGSAAHHIGRLSIDEEHRQHYLGSRASSGRGLLTAACSRAPAKRSASPERPGSRKAHRSYLHVGGRLPPAHRPRARGSLPSAALAPSSEQKNPVVHRDSHGRGLRAPPQKDPGCETVPSRSNAQLRSGRGQRNLSTVNTSNVVAPHSRYPELILQPESSPISQDELATEVKGIYRGLVMVEAKCVNIDAAQAADPSTQLDAEQWQALIALHRTLLYEHHDFLMATQHPSATPALRSLATKYSMPARMWKHGIHAFLEVLRHRRPQAQEYMLAFIYLAYQMMALLYETVPGFTDTWIECLGDLARYRMAIEEDKETHATWGRVAAHWYSKASDRHPAIGRLYHHLGILERPSLRKFYLYAKSLSCVIPFYNAHDSVSTLCGPIVQNEHTIESSRDSFEARAVTFHALHYCDSNASTTEAVGADTLSLIREQHPRLREIGANLAIANIAAIFQLGESTNMHCQLYTAAISQAMRSTRSSMSSTSTTNTAPAPDFDQLQESWTRHVPSSRLQTALRFCYAVFNTIATRCDDENALFDYLAYVHIMLVWFHSLHLLRGRLNEHSHHPFESLIDSQRVSWVGLADYLNSVLRFQAISARVLECARQGVFPVPERKDDARPLLEDYLLRGLIWGQFYFRPGWFDGQTENDVQAFELKKESSAPKTRAERVLWLGLFLALHTGHISYDLNRRMFCAPIAGPSTLISMATQPTGAEAEPTESCSEHVAATETVTIPQSPERPSSSHLHSEDDFTLVQSPHHLPAATLSPLTVSCGSPKSEVSGADLDVLKAVGSKSMDWTSVGGDAMEFSSPIQQK